MQTLQHPSFKNNYLFQMQIFLVDIQAQSSNVNEVIRAVLNSLFFYYCFFFAKRLCTHQNHQKYKDATKQKHNTTHQSTKSTKSTMTRPSKSTKCYKRTVRVWWSHYHTYEQKLVSWDRLKKYFLNKEVLNCLDDLIYITTARAFNHTF